MTTVSSASNRCRPGSRSLPSAILALPLLAATAPAQCDLQWQGISQSGGVNGSVHAIRSWDPDGAGPLSTHVIAGGQFTEIGSVAATNIAVCDLGANQWTALGSGTDGIVRAVLRRTNGDLIAGGSFTNAGGVAANGVARWDGSAWQAMDPSPMPGAATVFALEESPAGDLFAAFTDGPDGTGAFARVARWTGSSWSILGPNFGGAIRALEWRSNGELVAGGQFSTIGGAPAAHIATWNGTAWAQLGPGFQPTSVVTGDVYSIDSLSNGWLVIAGSVFGYLQFWDGTQFFPVSPITDILTVRGVRALSNNRFVAFGSGVKIWNQASWSAVANTANQPVNCVDALPDGHLAIGGDFTQLDGRPVSHLGRWNGINIGSLGTGLQGRLLTTARAANGDVLLGGEFGSIGTAATANAVRWTGTEFVPLGQGVPATVYSFAEMPDGDVVAGCDTFAYRFHGSTWTQLPQGLNGRMQFLAVTPSGQLYVAGTFFDFRGTPAGVARWTGGSWASLGTGIALQWLVDWIGGMAVLPDGRLIVGGHFASAGGVPGTRNLAIWNGTTWQAPPAAPPGPIVDLVVDGDRWIASDGNSVMVFDGAAWTAMPPVSADAGYRGLTLLPDGDALQCKPGGPNALFRWDHVTGVRTQVPGLASGPVEDLVALADDTVLAVGSFAQVSDNGGGTQPAGGMALLTAPCPATTAPIGAGCSSSTAPLATTVDSLPWIDSVFRTTTTGFAPSSFAIWQLGTAQLNVPMAQLHPAGGIGCQQWVLPDLTTHLLLPQNGSVSGAVFLPNDPFLVGLVLYHQVAGIEVDPSLQITRIAGGNAVSLTFGVY